MKLLTKEQEQEHYNQTLKGGAIWGFSGLAVGLVGVIGAHRRYHFIRSLTPALKAFLVTSSGTFAGIIGADHYSREYEAMQNPKEVEFRKRQQEQAIQEKAGKTFTERALEFGKKERYKIVGGSWVASIAAAWVLVNRNKYLTGAQKIVQARVYAQFLTVGVLIATAAFEISDQRKGEGRYETVRYIDPKDPEHKRMIEKQVEKDSPSQGSGSGSDETWRQMVEEEEQRLKAREEKHKEYEKEHHKEHEKKHKNGGKKQEEKEGKEEKEEKGKKK
ncbi:Replication factor C, subunit RFC4 [Cladophialophora chaetospira]|uniref:Replication factor C, subunit RFC4 n=1 Tax=Cladophialophora chaetospira TaxID=386627 RepID=A0AA39CBB9_9EURO|nr:Replication factor C, subunit RFC4 [Cladophialophora chaetospira]